MISKFHKQIYLAYRVRFSFNSKNTYILSQFPYPSGELHLGHARVYYLGESMCIFHRMCNLNRVIYPIGWDSFGLPAQNAAIKYNTSPKEWTINNIAQMKQQLSKLGIQFDWQMELSTSDPHYYQCTQKLFLKLFQEGLAYQKMAEVNWDPIDKTVLADEQVDTQGCSWRSGAKVEKKFLKQWFLKISAYAKELTLGLKQLKWPEKVKAMQKGWIGYKEGYFVEMYAQFKNGHKQYIQVFMENLQNLQKAAFILCQHESRQLLGYANSLIDGQFIPIYSQPNIQAGNYQLFIKNEETLKLLPQKALQVKSKAKKGQIMHIRDWLISRQRYWGTPIPIIHCPSCGTVPVPESQLPVLLPPWKSNKTNPLMEDTFKLCMCPNCGRQAVRECDTMDTFMDSSWYYLQFIKQKTQSSLIPSKITQFMPIDLYVGGIEHAIMHLLYARFIMKFIAKSEKMPSYLEQPFTDLLVQGLVHGKTYQLESNGKYLTPTEAQQLEEKQKIKITYQKMSKSKFNGVNPTHFVDKFSSDALRITLLFAGPPQNDINFDESQLKHAFEFLEKVNSYFTNFSSYIRSQMKQTYLEKQLDQFDEKIMMRVKVLLERMRNSMTQKYLNAYVANVMELFNLIKQITDISFDEKVKKIKLILEVSRIFIISLSVIAPIKSSELKKHFLVYYPKDQSWLWPKQSMISNKTEILLMDGKKLLLKSMIDVDTTNQGIQDIVRKTLGKPMQINIKRYSKNIVVFLK